MEKQGVSFVDKIHCLLGISDSRILPNYHDSVREVYLSFARLGLDENMDLILQLSRWENVGSSDALGLALPSWVPALSSRKERLSPTDREQSASIWTNSDGSKLPQSWPKPFTEGDTLFVNGVVYESISWLAYPIKRDNAFNIVSDCVNERSTSSRYVTGIHILEAVLRVLLLDRDLESYTNLGNDDNNIRKHIWVHDDRTHSRTCDAAARVWALLSNRVGNSVVSVYANQTLKEERVPF
jgi:hypothetical protein